MSTKKTTLRIPIYSPQHKLITNEILKACKRNEYSYLELQLTIVNDKQDIPFTFVDIFKVENSTVLPSFNDIFIESIETKDNYIVIEFHGNFLKLND